MAVAARVSDVPARRMDGNAGPHALARASPTNWHDGWQGVMALFAIWNGAKFLLSPSLFATFQVYRYLLRDPFASQSTWGALLVVYGLASLAGLFSSFYVARSFLAITGAAIWLYLGTQLTLGALGSQNWIGDGPFIICAGLGCAWVTINPRNRR